VRVECAPHVDTNTCASRPWWTECRLTPAPRATHTWATDGKQRTPHRTPHLWECRRPTRGSATPTAVEPFWCYLGWESSDNRRVATVRTNSLRSVVSASTIPMDVFGWVATPERTVEPLSLARMASASSGAVGLWATDMRISTEGLRASKVRVSGSAFSFRATSLERPPMGRVAV